MAPNDTAGQDDPSKPSMRERVRELARREVGRVPAVDRRLRTQRDDQARLARLDVMLERLRRALAPDAARKNNVGATIEEAERAALRGTTFTDFFLTATTDGDLARAAVTVVRDLIADGSVPRARSLSHVLCTYPDLTPIGELCRALVAVHDPMPDTAWKLFSRNHDLALRLTPSAYVCLGFRTDVDAAASALTELVDRVAVPADAPIGAWLDMARAAFAAGREDLAERVVHRAGERIDDLPDDRRATRLREEVELLRSWLGRAAQARRTPAVPDDEISFAILDHKQPDARVSPNLGDPVVSLAALGHLVRRSGVRFTGDAQLRELAETLRAAVAPAVTVPGDDVDVRLCRVDRDASSYSAVPEDTWTIVAGWLMNQVCATTYDLPPNPRLNPLYVGIRVSDVGPLTPDSLAHLRAHGPIGCRDWDTVALLQAADVRAFFSGCLSMTVDAVVPPAGRAGPQAPLLSVGVADVTPHHDSAADLARIRRWELEDLAAAPAGGHDRFGRSLRLTLEATVQRLASYRDDYERVVTSRLLCYLPLRALGARVDFRPRPVDARLDWLTGLDDAGFDALRARTTAALDATLRAVLSGAPREEVYATWRRVTAEAVAEADARRDGLPEIPPPTFDVAAACRAVHAASVTVERTAPAPDGDEIAVEFSLDGNLRHQMGVILKSVVDRCSRPIRLYVLCRDHDERDYERMAALFPTVSFVWLPTDHVDYGRVIGMIHHITVATMDRLLLPDLLPDVHRIVHHDLDALCLADLAELHDVDMSAGPIAARDSMHPNGGSGFRALRRAARRLREDPQRGRELIMRSHARHRFDFVAFNAGIMVFDLDRMRADSFCRQFLPYAERFGLNDQEILNAYAGAERVDIDPAWNAFPRLEIVENPRIIHWLGALKPWSPLYVSHREVWRAADAAFREHVRRVRGAG